jgi:hypothetical protein
MALAKEMNELDLDNSSISDSESESSSGSSTIEEDSLVYIAQPQYQHPSLVFNNFHYKWHRDNKNSSYWNRFR